MVRALKTLEQYKAVEVILSPAVRAVAGNSMFK